MMTRITIICLLISSLTSSISSFIITPHTTTTTHPRIIRFYRHHHNHPLFLSSNNNTPTPSSSSSPPPSNTPPNDDDDDEQQQQPATTTTPRATIPDDEQSSSSSSSSHNATTGDTLRRSSGKRPSLHPTTINAISTALLSRHTHPHILDISHNTSPENDDDDDDNPIDPHAVAFEATKIVLAALQKRKEAVLKDDGDELMIFNQRECQTVTGRVVGTVMRFPELERSLIRRVGGAGWVRKYGEWDSFGVLEKECAEEEGGGGGCGERVGMDPLFRMNRAECLLALFLLEVEGPKMKELGQELPGGSDVDFIDQERLDVLSSS